MQTKKNFHQKLFYLFCGFIILMSQLIINPVAHAEIMKEPLVAGDDPGVTITGPSVIESRQQVKLQVTLSASAGKLDKDGKIDVIIPNELVASPDDLTQNLVIDSPFYLNDPAVSKDVNGDYVLSVAYDHTKIDLISAVGATFTVKFGVPPIYEGDSTFPSSVDFDAALYLGADKVSVDSTNSQIIPTNEGNPLLSKWSTRPIKEVDGVKAAIMSQTDPSSNIFAIAVNYAQQNIKNAKIIDTIPNGTSLTDPAKYIDASGDPKPFNHFRIAKVTSRDEEGLPNGFSFVTNQFLDKIQVSETGFSIDFGDLSSQDSYVVMYAEKIDDNLDPSQFGVRYNKVELVSGDDHVRTSETPIALDKSEYQAVTLTKRVSQQELSTTDGELEYSLTLKSEKGSIPAGTIIKDPLPEFTKYLETTNQNSFFSSGDYDVEKNELSYTTLQELKEGESQVVKFTVHYKNDNAKPRDKITNRASINYAGTDIYSNDVTTTLESSAYLKKVDANNENPLAGAVFNVIDESGRIILQNLTSDQDGVIQTGLLEPGKYSFIETKAPENYVLDSTPVEFEVVKGQTTSIQLSKTNQFAQFKGDAILTKVDAETKNTLEGATFDLQDNNGRTIQNDLTTNENGEIVLKDLEPGEYQFVETSAPENYEIDTKPVKFEIKNNSLSSVHVMKENKHKNGQVTLEKIDADTKNTLAGAEFKLIDENGLTIKDHLVTDQSGKIVLDRLDTGRYEFVETKAPNGYILDPTPVQFQIKENLEVSLKLVKTNIREKSGTTGGSNQGISSSGGTQSQKEEAISDELPKTGDATSNGIMFAGLCMIALGYRLLFYRKVQ